MIVKHILIHNFFTFEHVDMELGEGPFFITGNNRDSSRAMSNGAGKSMFIQSIVWCLFDDLLRGGVLKDDVIGIFDTYCQVKLIIERDGKLIEIDRVRKHPLRGSSALIKVDGNNISKHKDKENIELVEKLLNISMKTLHYSAYSSRAVPSFMTLSPSKMKETVSEILDIARFDKHISEFTKIQKNLKNSVSQLMIKVSAKIAAKKELESDIVKLNGLIEVFNITSLAKITEYEDTIREKNIEMNNLTKSLSEINLDEIKIEMDQINEFISSIDTINGKIKENERSKSIRVNEKDRCMSDISGIVSKLNDYKSQLANLTTSNTDICVYCNSKMIDRKFIETKSVELTKKINEFEILAAEKRAYHDIVTGKISKLDSSISKLKAFVLESQASFTRRELLASMISNYEKVQDKIVRLIDDITNINNKIINIKNTTSEDLLSMLNDKTLKLEQNNKEEKELYKEINIKDQQQLYSVDIINAFKDLKSGIFNNFVLDFYNSINNNLEELTDGVFKCSYEVKGDELKFTFTDSSKSGKELPFIALSDGERCLISKAVSASLSDIINTGIIIDDEGLDGADTSVIPFIVEFILSKYKGRTFFFVGHQTILNDLFDGYTNIHIVKENGKSKAYINQ